MEGSKDVLWLVWMEGDAKVVGWWLVSGRGKGGVSVAVAAETLEGLPGGGMKLVPSQARWKKGDASFFEGKRAKKMICLKVLSGALGG